MSLNGYKAVVGDIAFPEGAQPGLEHLDQVLWDELPTGLFTGERRFAPLDGAATEDAMYAAAATPVIFRELSAPKKVKCAHTDAVLITGSSVKSGERVALVVDIFDQTTYLKAPPGAGAAECRELREQLEEMLTTKLRGVPSRGKWVSSVRVTLRSLEEPGGFEPEPMFAVSALNREVHRAMDGLVRDHGVRVGTKTIDTGFYDLTSVSAKDWCFSHLGIAPFRVYELAPPALVRDGITMADREYRCTADALRVVEDPSALPGARTELLDALHIAVMDIETMAINPDLTSGKTLTARERTAARAVDDHGFPQAGQSAICQIGLGAASREGVPGPVTGLPGAPDEALLLNLGPTVPASFGSASLDSGGDVVRTVACTSQATLLALYYIALGRLRPGLEMGWYSHSFDWLYIDELTRVLFESVSELGIRLLGEYGLSLRNSWSSYGLVMDEPVVVVTRILSGRSTARAELARIDGAGDAAWVVRTWLSEYVAAARRRVAVRREFREGLGILGRPGDGSDTEDRFMDELGPALADGVVRRYVPDWDARLDACDSSFYRALLSLLSWVRPFTNCMVRVPGIRRTPDRLHAAYRALSAKQPKLEEHKVFTRKFVDALAAERAVRVSWSKQAGTRKATFPRAVGFSSVDGMLVYKDVKKTENEYGLKATMRKLAKRKNVADVLVLEAPYSRITPRMIAALRFWADCDAGRFASDAEKLAAARVHLAGAHNLGVYCACSDVPAVLAVVSDMLGFYKAVGSMSGAGVMDVYMGVSCVVRGAMYDVAHEHTTSFPPRLRDEETDTDPEEAPSREDPAAVAAVLPATDEAEAGAKAKKLTEAGYTGATVLFMRRGRYPGWCVVVVTDFAHLYPAIMISNSVGASSMICPPADRDLGEYLGELGLTLDDVYRPTLRAGDPVYRRTVKYVDAEGVVREWRGTLAATEDRLLKLREHYKAIMKAEEKVVKHLAKHAPALPPDYEAFCAALGVKPATGTPEKIASVHEYRSGMANTMQLAAKVICNSAYGFVGQKSSFFPTACAGSVTAGGMTSIMVAKGMFESMWRVGRQIPSIAGLTAWADAYRALLESEGEAAHGLVVDVPAPVDFEGDVMARPREMWDALRAWALVYSKPSVDRYYKVDGAAEIAQLDELRKKDGRAIGVSLQKRARLVEGDQTIFRAMKIAKRVDASAGLPGAAAGGKVVACTTCSGVLDPRMQAQLPLSLREIGCVVTTAPGAGPGYHLHRPLEMYEVDAGPCPVAALRRADTGHMSDAAFRRFERWCEMRLGDLAAATPERVADAVDPARADEAVALARAGEMTRAAFEEMQPPCGVWFDATTVYGDTDSTFVNVVALSPYVAHFVCEMIEALTRLAFVVPKDLVFEAEKFFMARPEGLIAKSNGKLALPPSDDPMFPGVKMTSPSPEGVGFWGKSMKQYAGLKVEIRKMAKIGMSQTGLVGKKRGVPGRIKTFLGDLLNAASLGYTLAELESMAAAFFGDLATGKYGAADLCVTAAYNPEKDGMGKKLAAVLAEHGIHVGPGTRIKWYYGAAAVPRTKAEARALRDVGKTLRAVPYDVGVRQGIPPDFYIYVKMAIDIAAKYLRDAYETPDVCRLAMARMQERYTRAAREYLDGLEHVGRIPLDKLGVESAPLAERRNFGLMSMFAPACHCGATVPSTSRRGVALCPTHAAERVAHLRLEVEGAQAAVEKVYDHCRTGCPVFATGNFLPSDCMELECGHRVRVLGEQVRAANAGALVRDLEDLVRP